MKQLASSNSISWDTQLIKRHDLAGPRYTSYPTALQFDSSLSSINLLQQAKSTLQINQPLSLYFHIPFCAHVCYYCACNKVITAQRQRAQPYLDSLYQEMQYMAGHYSAGREVRQLHIGGGTPTFLSDSQLAQLMEKARQLFNLVDDQHGDFSIEIDPRECSADSLRNLRAIGFNRISIGIQDLHPQVQQAVNRVQDTGQIVQLIKQAKAEGFKSINVDLIYGLPHQSVESFSDTLAQVIEMSVDRLSVFNYAHMPDRFRPQRHIRDQDLPSPAQKLAIQQQSIIQLTEAGYVYIGMDHFAKPDDELSLAQASGQLQRNFQGYTTHADCDLVAMGVSAISKIGDLYYQNAHDLSIYTDLIEKQQQAICRGVTLTRDDKIRRDLIKELICHCYLDIDKFAAQQQLDFSQYFAFELAQLEPLAKDGLLAVDHHSIQLTASGRLLVRRVCMIFDRYLPRQEQQKFSRII